MNKEKIAEEFLIIENQKGNNFMAEKPCPLDEPKHDSSGKGSGKEVGEHFYSFKQNN